MNTSNTIMKTADATPNKSKETSIGRASSVMFAGTLLSRLTGAIRTIVLAAFGLEAVTDAYTQANTTPNMIFELVAGGVLSATLIPLFAQLFRRNTKRAQDGIDAIVSLLGVVVVAASVFLALGAPLILRLTIRGAENADKRHLAEQLLPMFAPQVAIYGFVAIATALLNVRRRFFAPMIAPVLNNLLVIGVLLWVRRLLHRGTGVSDLTRLANDPSTRLLLGFGTTAGVLAMGLALIPALRKSGVRLRWRWEPRHPAIREIIRISGWTLGYVACNQFALFVIQRLANRKDGDYTAYTLAYQTYFLLPHGLFAVSIATALQPRLSDAFLERKRGLFRSTLSRGITTQLAIMIPSAVGYLVLAKPIITVLAFGRLGPTGVNRLASTLQAFVVGLPAFSVFLLLMNACKAMRDTKLAFWVNGLETLANIGLAVLFASLGYGVRGLAYAYGLAYCLGVVLAFVAVSRRTKGLHVRSVTETTARIVAASTGMGAVTWGFRTLVHHWLTDSLQLATRLVAIGEVGVSILAGVTVYILLGRILGIRDLQSIVAGITRRFRPGSSRKPPPAFSNQKQKPE
jgi:putative peptidoglycan lipid II flippase